MGKDDAGDWRERIVRGVDRFVDIRGLAPDEAARRIDRDRIDILVDLMGLMRPHAFPILARRPAPIQVSFLGYPGTMGVDYVDYLIADSTVAPPEHQPYYTERLYQVPRTWAARRLRDDRIAIVLIGHDQRGLV